MSVSHEIPVLSSFGTCAFRYPVPILRSVEDVVLGVVDECPAVCGEQTVLKGHGVLGVAVLIGVAVVAVEGAVGALQVALLLGAGCPGKGHAESLGGDDAEVLGAQWCSVLLVGELELAGRDDHLAAARGSFVWHAAVFADDSHEALVVNELAVGSILQADGSFVDEGEADCVVAIDLLGLCRAWHEGKGQ